jgi:hypothetical protein
MGLVIDGELVAELLARVGRDQRARARVGRGPVDSRDWVAVEAVDRDNTAWFSTVVQAGGWPARSVVGERAADAAWLLAQHADHDVAFQQQCLALLAQAVAGGEADPAHLAYLTDRVLRAEGKPQRYGTQFWADPDDNGRFVPQPIEDLDGLDQRRRAFGLEPFADYEKAVRGPPDQVTGTGGRAMRPR